METGSMNPPVDLVYTWVDDGQADYAQLLRRYGQTAADVNPERTRDLYTLLKYSLRSAACYAPWVQNIYIVTQRPQCPAWLNTAHPRVRVIHHDEIVDRADYLPTFSCHVIESYLHRIPGLQDYFLYLNDDYLFGNRVAVSDFLDADGRLRVYGTLCGERFPFIYDDWRSLLYNRLQHEPLLIYKPFYAEMLERWATAVQRTRQHRFRAPWDVWMHGLYRYYLLTRQAARVRAVPVWEYQAYYQFHKLQNDYAEQCRGLARLRAKRPKFYCLNDDQGLRPQPGVVALIRDFLAGAYPEPSPYERQLA